LHNPIKDFDMVDANDYRHTNDIIKKDGVFVNCDLNGFYFNKAQSFSEIS
jgi:hypothetical protein